MEAEASVLALLPTDAYPLFMMDIRTVRTCQTHSHIGFSGSDRLIEVVG